MIEQWWNYEIEFYVSECGYTLNQARTFTILRWMWEGDLRPLQHAIMEKWELDDAVLLMLADMISDKPISHPYMARYKIKAEQRTRSGRSKDPEEAGRAYMLGTIYDSREIGSEPAFEAIAKHMGMSHQTVRNAVTAWRKMKHSAK
jgi:hypothetical protein